MLCTYLPLVLYAYCSRTATHSTGISHFQLMFGQQPKLIDFSLSLPLTRPTFVQSWPNSKIWLRYRQPRQLTTKRPRMTHSKQRTFKAGDPVWLSACAHRGKTQPTMGRRVESKGDKEQCQHGDHKGEPN